MRMLTLLVCVLGTLGFAPAPFPKPERSSGDPNRIDLARMQGTWRLTKVISGGVEQRPPGSNRFVVSGSRMTGYDRGKVMSQFTIALQARANPKAIDLTELDTDGHSYRGVYSLQGETLILCVPFHDDSNRQSILRRPAAVAPGRSHSYEVFERLSRP